MKVVLDTNIWVSAIIWGGIPDEIIMLGQKQLLTIVPQLRDSDDSIVLATAIASQADVIITGDKDLLVLEKYQNIQIVTAKDFLQRYF